MSSGNLNYRRGYEAEAKAKKILELLGYTVERTAGSHGPFDLVAVNEDEVRLVQVKRIKTKDTLPFAVRQAIEELFELRCPSNVKREIWVWLDRCGWVFKEVIET